MENKKGSILIVDDNMENLISLRETIIDFFPDTQIIMAESGEKAIYLAKLHMPEIILLDILMPGMDGFETCRQIKASHDLEDIPVVFVTALKGDKENRLKALDSGAEAFISKPIDSIEVFVQLRSMLKIREQNVKKRMEKDQLNLLIDEKTQDVIRLKEKYRNILDDLPALVCEFMPDGKLTYVNKRFWQYYDTSLDALIGTSYFKLMPETIEENVIAKYATLSINQPSLYFSHQILLNDDERWQEWRGRAIFDANGVLRHFYSIGFDVTERKITENKLLHLSYHDYLTGLFNRRFFEEEIKRFDRVRYLPLTIVMADVNGLKLVNDSFGHIAGDTLLVKAAKALQEGCRSDDIVSRIGGDEFAILLPKTNHEDAEGIVNRIKSILNKNKTDAFVISISFGFETKWDINMPVNEVISNAENHMYRHKALESASMRSETINVVMNSLFEKSERESAHSKRVSRLCEAIATALNFSEEKVSNVRIAGLVHDIGKISVDEKVLNKCGSLNHDEWLEIKKHPESGRRILSSVKEFANIAESIMTHHERWDGKGYPAGLKGFEIPVEARIIAVADAYDAMTSERSYRKPLEVEEALFEIKKNSGIQFDPEVVDVFVKLIEDS